MLSDHHPFSRHTALFAAATGAVAAALVVVLPAVATGRHVSAGAPTVIRSTANEIASVSASSQSGKEFSLWNAQGSDGSSCLMLQETASGSSTYQGNLGGSCRFGEQPTSSPILVDVSWVPDGSQVDVLVRGTLAQGQSVKSVDATSGTGSVSFVQSGSAFLGELPSVSTMGQLPSGTWTINARNRAGNAISSLNLNELIAAAHAG